VDEAHRRELLDAINQSNDLLQEINDEMLLDSLNDEIRSYQTEINFIRHVPKSLEDFQEALGTADPRYVAMQAERPTLISTPHSSRRIPSKCSKR
jgi:hypothetical protein